MNFLARFFQQKPKSDIATIDGKSMIRTHSNGQSGTFCR
jgi:hypothetical protein